MTRSPAPFSRGRCRGTERGGLLITAMLIAAVIALGLIGYLNVSRTALRLAHRTYFANDAANLAEAGLEEALYCFNQMAAGAAPATAWAGWTTTATAAQRTLPPINRDQKAVAVVKIFVEGFNGSNAAPYVISQATITPFDGSPPIVKIIRAGLKSTTGFSTSGIVALNGLTFKGQGIADSFHSNPSNSPTGPWLPYSTSIARANTRVIVPSGTLSLGNGQIRGNLFIGPGVAVPSASSVTGSITRDYTTTFTTPTTPTAASVSRSYNLGSSLPTTLPAASHLPAADGIYYFFCNGATVGSVTVPTGRKIVIVGTNTSMTSGLNLQGTATCAIYIDGPVVANGTINNGSWAGALQIYTTTTAPCSIGNNSSIVACLYAPNADLEAKGGGSTGMLVGFFLAKTITATGHMDFHYDEALDIVSGGNRWQLTQWFEVASSTDRATVAAATGNFLP